MIHPRSVMWGTFASARMSTKPRKQNHYDTLEITPNATQEQIKSAYYRLTKIYHPDRNKNKGADEKFRNVSEAYEVLSSYQARKLYDQGASIRDSAISQNVTTKKTDDPRMKFYRKQAEGMRGSQTYKQHVYNFDEWTKAHYGSTFQKTKKLKEEIKTFREDNPSSEHPKMHIFEDLETKLLKILMMFAVLTIMMGIVEYKDYDKVVEIDRDRQRVGFESFEIEDTVDDKEIRER